MEIKFRAWETNKGLGSKMSMPFTLTDLHNKGLGVFGDTYIFMQFTGLYDKHNNPIYEGDIVKDRFNRIMKIGVWNYRMCFIAITETNFHHADFYDWILREDKSDDETFPPVRLMVEIIGNEFENPELLNNKENEVDI